MIHQYLTTEAKLGKKGQITIPKKIREGENLQEDDVFIVTHAPGGDIVLHKKRVVDGVDMMLKAIEQAPKFDWRQAWEEIKAERKRERS